MCIILIDIMSCLAKVVSSNPAHREVNSIQHYVIKFVCDLWQVDGTSLSSTNKTDKVNNSIEVMM